MAFITSKNIPKYIMILPIIGILVTTLLISGIIIYTLEQNFDKNKQDITREFFNNLQKTTKDRVNLTYNIIDVLYKQNNKDYNKTIHLMQKVLSKMRWEKRGYIFVFDYYGNTLYHPNHYYMTINRWNFERNGIKIIRLLIQSALKHPEGTYVKYLAYNPDGSPKQKVSFVKIYKPLKIVIGNGVYLDYLDKKLLNKQKAQQHLLDNIIKNIIISALIIFIIMLTITYYFSTQLKNLFERYDQEIQKEKEELFKKANFDPLTGLHNRVHFLLELKEHITLAKRENKQLAVLFVDLDHFKEINDSLGHQFGDKVLQTIAKRLKEIVRDVDIVARFGGDEFVILLWNIDIDEVIDIAQNIIQKIKEAITLYGTNYYLTTSIGIAISPNDSIDSNTIVKYADTAMYKAKKDGKDRFVFYTKEMSEEANRRIKIKNSIYKAVEQEEFELYFQPQIDRNGKYHSAEVLIRWHNDILLSPDEFIPLALEIGIIDRIDLWVLENTMIQYNKWVEKGYKPGILSCNVTMYHIEKCDFVNDLKKLLDKYSFNPKNLNLEITEQSVMRNPEKSVKVLQEIVDLGVEINIDDFGTGYSSLIYLKKLPLSKLKIDKSFITDIPENTDSIIITKTIINLAKNLTLQTIAEGVETEEQKDFVLENGVDYIQGFYYSKPLSARRFEEEFLKKI